MKNKLLLHFLFFILVLNLISCISLRKNGINEINYYKDSTKKEFKYSLEFSIGDYLDSLFLKSNSKNLIFIYEYPDFKGISNFNLLIHTDSEIVLKTYNFNLKKITYYKINESTYNDIEQTIKCLDICENYNGESGMSDDYTNSFSYVLYYNKNKYLIIENYSRHKKDKYCHDLVIKTLKAIVSEPIICPDLIYKTTNFEDELPDSVLYENYNIKVAPSNKIEIERK